MFILQAFVGVHKVLKKEYGCLLSLLLHLSSRKQEVLKSVELSFQDILSQLEASKMLELVGTDLMGVGIILKLNCLGRERIWKIKLLYNISWIHSGFKTQD
jgi:hypothetical protein